MLTWVGEQTCYRMSTNFLGILEETRDKSSAIILQESNKSTFTQAVTALGKKFNSGNGALAAQDFRHATQAPNETVTDYILRLE